MASASFDSVDAQTSSLIEPPLPVASIDPRIYEDRGGDPTTPRDSSPTAIIIADRLGRIRVLDRAAETLFGYRAAEVIGQGLQLLMPDAYAGEGMDLRECVRAEPDAGDLKIIGGDRDVVGRRKDGSAIDLQLTMVEHRGGNGLFCFANVKRRGAMEEAERARETAENANRAKAEFLAFMSHEIRILMTSLGGFVDLLNAKGTLTRQQRRYVDSVKTLNGALLAVVNDILDFSKLEAGRLELQPRPFSPTSLIRDAVGIVHPIASAKNLRVEYKIDSAAPKWLNGDQARLRQVLLNLLNNAIKFTAKGSIEIDARPLASSDGRSRIRFSVKDTGVGIAAECQRRLFEPFSQADGSVSRRHGGTGLGLAICKRIVEVMDGEIGISSEIGRGTTVWFTADLAATSQPIARTSRAPPFEDVDALPARILVVDDIDANCEIVRAFLEDEGYRVDTVGNTADAIRMIRDERYDLAMLDVRMPEIDGVAATKLIRAMPAPVKDIPIVAMTGNVLPWQVRSCLDAGMNDHVGKPIEPAELRDSVRRWLPKRRTET